MDGFTIRRMGDTQTRVRVILHLEHYPEQYKVSPELGSVIGLKQDSRSGVITALWNYIKINGLQDKADRRIIRTDPSLKQVCFPLAFSPPFFRALVRLITTVIVFLDLWRGSAGVPADTRTRQSLPATS